MQSRCVSAHARAIATVQAPAICQRPIATVQASAMCQRAIAFTDLQAGEGLWCSHWQSLVLTLAKPGAHIWSLLAQTESSTQTGVVGTNWLRGRLV